MIYEIVDALVTELTTLSFKDILVGIVKPLKVNVNNHIKTIPVVYNANATACDVGSYYLDLVPNSTKKSIIYFEEQGSRINGYTKNYIDMTSVIKLVGWFNYKKIDQKLHNSTLIMANVMKLIPSTLVNMTYIAGIRIEFEDVIEKTPEIFSRYTYDEAEHQYLTYPYDYFALRYSINFRVNVDCVPLVVADTTEC